MDLVNSDSYAFAKFSIAAGNIAAAAGVVVSCDQSMKPRAVFSIEQHYLADLRAAGVEWTENDFISIGDRREHAVTLGAKMEPAALGDYFPGQFD